MPHQRTLIREAAIAALSGRTAAGTRVLDSPIDPHRRGEVPAIGVYTPEDPVESETDDDAEQEHVLELKIGGWVKAVPGATLAATLDALALEIETAMALDPHLGGTVSKCKLRVTRMGFAEDNGASDPVVGILTMQYVATYYSRAPEPAELDEFLRSRATFPVVGAVDDTVPAQDLFNVRPS